ncbi:MAG: TIM barrel protein, partial [Candidatus Omnitrophica bacterium]|nr:TIM barrel protein [Candidatus Omnitrophota bacterium]
ANIRQKLKAEKFSVSALNLGINRWPITVDPDPDLSRFREVLKLVHFFDCQHLVISSFQMPKEKTSVYREEILRRVDRMVRLARDEHITLLLENEPQSYAWNSKLAADVVESIGSLFLRLAFNPANFARVGEKPFLGINSHIRKMAALLYVNDCLFSGSPRLPGQGNAEIKELISILRCRSFDGFFSIKPGLGGGKETFNQAAKSFWHLLETM